MNELEVSGLFKSYRTQSVLDDLSLTVVAGSFVSILGPSGSGKTTLLRIIAGFERADRGSLRLRDMVVDDETSFVGSDQRRIGYVPQDGNLFPHLSVAANVAFGLSRRDRHGARVAELLEMVGLAGLAKRYPHQLSGGQQQRVALARGLAIEPSLVLLDEPFSSLDAGLRASVRSDVRRVLKDAGTTAILVTHDQDEALSLADQVAIIRDGRISQCDEPARLYARPTSPELARELGNVNFLPGTYVDGTVDTPIGRFELEQPLSLSANVSNGTALLVLIRPEQISLEGPHSETRALARVVDTEFYGHDAVVKVRAHFDEVTNLVIRTQLSTELPELNSEVSLAIRGAVVAWPTSSDS